MTLRGPLFVIMDDQGWLGAGGKHYATAEDAKASLYSGLAKQLSEKYLWAPPPEPASPAEPLRVFVSYVREDRAVILQLVKRLRSARVQPWFDEDSLLPGQRWKDEIDKAIAETDLALVCLSKKAVTKEGHMNVEIVRVLERAERLPEGTLFIVPIRLDECVLPRRLADYHWADYFAEAGYQKIFDSLSARALYLKKSMPVAEAESKR